jgi:hypothetical protein
MPFLIRPSRRFPLTCFSGLMALIALLVLSSGPAYSEWVPYGTSNEGIYAKTSIQIPYAARGIW